MFTTKTRFRRARPAALCARPLFLLSCCCIAAFAGIASQAPAADLSSLGCGGCHQLDEPPAEDRTLQRYTTRKGPDLFYAGDKYRPEWLQSWLLEPAPIRPAGLNPASSTTASTSGDVVEEPPFQHPSISPEEVDGVVDALRSRTAKSDLVDAATVERTKIPRPLAKLNFDKFKGCGSCHRTNDSMPPLSGPDLQGAYTRLREEFLFSYISQPEQWDPVAPMPGYGLAPAEVGKLVEYLRLLSEEK